MMTVTISDGIVILLLFLQNTYAQSGVSSNVANNAAISQSLPTGSSAGTNYGPLQTEQQMNWQQLSNIQAPLPQQSQTYQQPGVDSQVKQQNQIPLSDIFNALHNLRLSSQKPPGGNLIPSGPNQNYEQAPTQSQSQPGSIFRSINLSPTNQVSDTTKPTYTFQFVPVSQNPTPETQVMQNIPIQYLSGQSQMPSQQGPSYYVQNSKNCLANPQGSQTNSAQNTPIIFTVNSHQASTGQSQPMVYTLQAAQQYPRSSNQQNRLQPAQGNNNPMGLMMSQLQAPSANIDISSILPMLMNSRQEKMSGMKALLPLILNLLNDKGCGCPNCGCPYNNAEPVINGGYSNQMNYSPQNYPNAAKTPEATKSMAKNTDDSTELEIPKTPKKHKANVINDESDEISDEDDEYEDYDD